MLFTIFLFCLIVAFLALVYAGAVATQESTEGAMIAVSLIRLGLWLVVIATLVAAFVNLVKIGVIHPF